MDGIEAQSCETSNPDTKTDKESSGREASLLTEERVREIVREELREIEMSIERIFP